MADKCGQVLAAMDATARSISSDDSGTKVNVVEACGPWVIATVSSKLGEYAALEVAKSCVARVTQVRHPGSDVSAAVADGPIALAAVSSHGSGIGRTIEITGQPVFSAMVLAARTANGRVVAASPAVTDLD